MEWKSNATIGMTEDERLTTAYPRTKEDNALDGCFGGWQTPRERNSANLAL